MFRSPKPGDWAAEDDETVPVATVPPSPDDAKVAEVAPASTHAPVQDTRRDDRGHAGGRFDRDRISSEGRLQRNAGRFDRDRKPDREERQFDRDRGSDRDGGHFNRDRGSNRDGGRFDRDRSSGQDGGRFERDRENTGGRFDLDRNGGRDGGRFDRDRSNSREGEHRDQGEGRADVGRWGRHADRRGYASGGRDLPVEQGFVVSIKETFGFVSCLDREGDLFFHISEAPVDVQLHDEVDFRVKYNQRSDKDVACQLVALPKGTIKVEVIDDEVIDGVVTKSLPRVGRGNGRGSFNGDRHHNREEHGVIEIKSTRDSEDTKEIGAKEEALEDVEQSKSTDKKTLVRREFVRFNSDSVATVCVNCGVEDEEQSDRPNKSLVLHCGDEVCFRVAKHRKTGAKRAVDITVLVSARDKFETEIEAKLATMTRETGIVNRVKNGGGFIKCCDRPVDIYFHFREILGSVQSDEDKKSGEHADGQSGGEPQRSQPKKECSVREGDEVSFFVYENPADDSTRSQLRLMAVRVQKLPPGTVSFEKLLQADVKGLVLTPPQEPRNGAEVTGKIAVIPVQASATDKSDKTAGSAIESAPNSDEKTVTTKKGKDDKDASRTVAFRLRDIEDVNYFPRAEDEVVFDEVLDKRTGKVKAAKIRVVQLNPKNRETGTVNAMKEDFGFIKCAERSGDAYFSFLDVTGSNRSFGNGTEVAFDIDVDNKSDHIRATRVQILPRGTVKWEDVVDESLEGIVVALPSSKGGHASNRGGRGDKMKRLQKFVPGKINFGASQKQHVIDFLPDLKEKLDAAFIASEDVVDELQKVDDEEKKSEKAEDSTEIRILFPSTLSKFERAALHDYSAWLGLKTRSNGEGSHSQLEIYGTGKISLEAVEEKRANSAPELTVVLKEDDLVDVRYNPKVGDRVRFNLVMVRRTKELRCTSVACLEAAAISKTKVASVKSDAVTGEGCIISVKPEGFGFIQPAQAGLGSLEENLFFHIKDVTTGQTLADLKEGTEVQYTIYVNEKKDKKRAMSVRVVPAGTIKIDVPKSVKGIVTKASFLQRMKGGGKGRFAKASNKASTLGRIMLVAAEDSAEDNAAAFHNGAIDSDDTPDEGEEVLQQATSEDAGTSEQSAPGVAKKVEEKKFEKQVYFFNIRDIDDPSVVLREGDEVEFIPQMQQKTPRAAHVRLIASHAKHGVVTHITEDLGGVICLDGEEPAVKARFTARGVLCGDTLREGDRVEFAYRPSSASVAKNESPKSDIEEKKAERNEEGYTKEIAEVNEESTKVIMGQALSVLHLSSSPDSTVASPRRGSRMVNSTLKEAMRQVGANAMVASRMAKGPNGTRGFAETWNLDPAAIPEVMLEEPNVESSTASVTAAGTTEQCES